MTQSITTRVACHCQDEVRPGVMAPPPPVASENPVGKVTDVAAAVDAATSRLAGELAHDFNNALTVIMGYCQILEFSVADQAVLGHVMQIRGAAERCCAFNQRLLSLRLKRSPRPREVRLADIGTLILHAGRPWVPAGVEFTVTVAAERVAAERVAAERVAAEPVTVWTDPTLLREAVGELIRNGFEASGPGGEVVVEISRQGAKPTESGGATASPGHGPCLTIVVRDRGEGLPDDVRDHLFELLRSTRGKGRGLGLFRCRSLVRLLGGKITIESQRGAGTTVRLVVPVGHEC